MSMYRLTRHRKVVLSFVAIMLVSTTLACTNLRLGGSNGEATPAPGSATLTLVNNSDETVCGVYISWSGDGEHWGEDLLGETGAIPPDGTFALQMPPGTYHLRAENCFHSEIDVVRHALISGEETWVISPRSSQKGGDATLTAVNVSGEPICYLYISPATDTVWTGESLSPDTILNGSFHLFSGITPGSYDLRARGCGGDEIQRQMSVSITEDYVWMINGGLGSAAEVDETTIRCDQTVTGQLNEGEEHYWTFNGAEGDVVTIAMNGTDGMDTYLRLRGPNGNELTTDDDSGSGLNSLIANYRLPANGTYTIVAHGFAYRGGSYSLLLTCGGTAPPLPAGGLIGCGQTVTGQLNEGEEHFWTFDASSGDAVTIAMNGIDGMDTYLHLLGPSGNELITDDDSGSGLNSLIANYRVPTSGPYTIVARGFGHQGGSYSLSLTCGEAASAAATLTVINDSGTAICQLNISPVTDSFWTGEMLGGDTIPDGLPYTFSDIVSGDYDLRAADCNGNILGIAWAVSLSPGDHIWTITGTSVPAPPPSDSTIGCGQTVTGQLANGEQDQWTFDAAEEDMVITIAMNETDGMDTFLELLDSDGNELTRDDDSGPGLNSLIANYQLPASGIYTIVARGFADQGGSYNLSLSCGETEGMEEAPEPGPGAATLMLTNNSEETICRVYISPVTDMYWGDNWLGATETIPPGDSRAFSVAPGRYDLLAADCADNELDTVWDVPISADHTWTVP